MSVLSDACETIVKYSTSNTRTYTGNNIKSSSPRSTCVINLISVVNFLTWLKLATVQIGTYWSLSI